jgi:hypothetical protein
MIRKIQAQAQWVYLKNNNLAKQPNCNFSTCSQLSGCNPITYQTYEQKYNVSLGKYLCDSCSTTTQCFPS